MASYTPENNPYIKGDPYSYDLKWMVEQIKGWKDPADSADRAKASEDAAKASELNSEAWAVGEKDGEPVDPAEPQHDNNSKFWAGEAADSAAEAKDYADHIADPVAGLVTDWLNDHITQPTTPAIDTSLSVVGAAADAKAAGDGIRYNKKVAEWAQKEAFSLLETESEAGFLKADGSVYLNPNYWSSVYIAVKSGKAIGYKLSHATSGLPILCFYTDMDQTTIDATQTINGINGYSEGTYTPPSDGFIRVTYYTARNDVYLIFNPEVPDNVKVRYSLDVLTGINVLCLGDSIFGNDEEIVADLNLITKGSFINCAFGGTRVSNRGGSDNFQYFDGINLVSALCSQDWTAQDAAAIALQSTYPWVPDRLARLKAVDMSAVNVITMNWGTNDYTQAATISDITAAYNSIIDMLQRTYPTIRILILTPIWRYFGAKSDNENGDNKIFNESTLKEIVAAIENNAKDKRIEVFNMYQKMPLSYNTADSFFDVGSGVHLNAAGNLLFAHIMAGNMRTMF